MIPNKPNQYPTNQGGTTQQIVQPTNPGNSVIQYPTNPTSGKDPYNQIQYYKNLYETNPTNKGLQTWASNQAQNYYSQLDPNVAKQLQGMNAAQLGEYRNSLGQPQQQQNQFNQFNTQSATIEDIAKKYGFDFSREASARQAEAEAQAKRDAANQGKRAVDSRVEGSADALDRDYFQRYMQQAQGQTNSGLNGGIASDQNLRMAMARQANMGDIYRDANLEHARLEDALGRVELERLAREDGLHFDRTMAGAGLAMDTDRLNLSRDQFNFGMFDSNRGYDRSVFESDRNFNYGQERDQIGDARWRETFDYGKERDLIGDSQWQQGFDWNQESYWNDFNNLSAYQQQALAAQRASGGGGGGSMTPNQMLNWFEKYAEQMYNNQRDFISKNQGQLQAPFAPKNQLEQILALRPQVEQPKAPTFTGGPMDQYAYLRK